MTPLGFNEKENHPVGLIVCGLLRKKEHEPDHLEGTEGLEVSVKAAAVTAFHPHECMRVLACWRGRG